MDCPLSPTLCEIPVCGTDGSCSTKTATDGATGSDHGGEVCSKGKCVACNETSDFSPNNVCQNHACMGECTDGVKDGNETSTDCGGGSCPACAVGSTCGGNNDCVSDAACVNCSVDTPQNLGADCTTSVHCSCGSNLPGEIDCAGKCIPTDSCGCCGQFPC